AITGNGDGATLWEHHHAAVRLELVAGGPAIMAAAAGHPVALPIFAVVLPGLRFVRLREGQACPQQGTRQGDKDEPHASTVSTTGTGKVTTQRSKCSCRQRQRLGWLGKRGGRFLGRAQLRKTPQAGASQPHFDPGLPAEPNAQSPAALPEAAPGEVGCAAVASTNSCNTQLLEHLSRAAGCCPIRDPRQRGSPAPARAR